MIGSPLRAELRTLTRLAVPVVLTQLASMLMGLVDTLMVSRLGTEALAATALGHTWVIGTLMIGIGVVIGIDPIITQAYGAGDNERVGRALQQALVLALLMSIPLIGVWFLTERALLFAKQAPALASLAQRYVTPQMIGAPAFLIYIAQRHYLSGRSIMKPALWVMLAGNVVNVILNWVLIFGHLGFEPRGVAGAGLASGLSRVFLAVALAAFIFVRRLHVEAWVPWSRRAFEWQGLREVLRHGLPVGVQVGLEIWGWQLATFLAGYLGAVQLAAHSIVLNCAAFTFMAPLGVSIAATTRVGNLMGAGDPVGARRAAGVALGMGTLLMTVAAIAFSTLRWILPLPFKPAPEVLAWCAAILPVAAAFQIFDGAQVIASGILRGAGDTRPAAVCNFIGYYVLGVPVGFVLAVRLGYGLVGVWAGLVVGLFTVSILLVWRIRVSLGVHEDELGLARSKPGS